MSPKAGRLIASTIIAILTAILVGCGGEPDASSAGVVSALYSDNFDAAAGPWITEADALGRTALENGRLIIEVQDASALQYATLREPSFADFDLTVDATLQIGGAQASYGVLFRMASPSEFYRFEVSGDGRYIVERRNAAGTWTRLVDGWQASPAIRVGADQVNALRVVAQGPQMSFYANGERLRTLDDASYAAGTIALDAGTFGPGHVVAAFDNLVIAEP
jgi:hypothetical protein